MERSRISEHLPARMAGLTAAAGIALSLAAMPALAADASQPADATASEAASAVSDGQTQPVTLFIGHDQDIVEVVAEAEPTPQGLIEVLARETGWDLSLACDPVYDEGYDTYTVTFAEDSAIHTGQSSDVADAYRADNEKDFVYLVLNSVAHTLQSNVSCSGVCFAAPDGGAIELSRDGFDLYVSNYFLWYESSARLTNGDVADDGSLGCYPSPVGTVSAGLQLLNLYCLNEDVVPGEGTITVTDSQGNIVDEIDVTDPERVIRGVVSEVSAGQMNARSCVRYDIALTEPLKPNEHYEISLNKEAFTDGERTLANDVSGKTWYIDTLGFGIGGCSVGPTDPVKLGEPLVEEYILDESIEKITIEVLTPDTCEASATELTESGAVTYTPLKEGVMSYVVSFIMKDGSTPTGIYGDYVIVGANEA